MTNLQMTEEMKRLVDQYNSGNLTGENLRRLRRMLKILTDDVTLSMETTNKDRRKQIYEAV